MAQSDMSKNQSGAFFGGLLLGTAAGTVAGLLLAPRRGRETRKFLAKSADALPDLAEDLASSLQLQGGRLSSTANRRWGTTLERLREAIAAGIAATHSLDEESDEGPDGEGSQRQQRYADLANGVDGPDETVPDSTIAIAPQTTRDGDLDES